MICQVISREFCLKSVFRYSNELLLTTYLKNYQTYIARAIERFMFPADKSGKISLRLFSYSSEGISLDSSSMAFSFTSVSSCLFLNSGIRPVDLE